MGSQGVHIRPAQCGRATAHGPYPPHPDLQPPPAGRGIGKITLALIVMSVLTTLLTKLGQSMPLTGCLLISQYDTGLQGLPGMLARLTLLPEIRHGQLWRLLSPMLLHFHVLHILFNMMWFKDLGGVLEARQGSFRFLGLVLTFGVLTNVTQYVVSGPLFGGMSGVVYGLLGYVWIRGELDASFGVRIRRGTIQFMLIWLVLCYTPVIPHVANTAHTVGLASGMLAGLRSSGYLQNGMKGRTG